MAREKTGLAGRHERRQVAGGQRSVREQDIQEGKAMRLSTSGRLTWKARQKRDCDQLVAEMPAQNAP